MSCDFVETLDFFGVTSGLVTTVLEAVSVGFCLDVLTKILTDIGNIFMLTQILVI